MKRLAVLLLGSLLWLCPAGVQAYSMTTEDLYPQTIESTVFASLVTDRVEQALSEAGEKRRHTIDIVRVPRILRTPEGTLSYDVSLPNGLRYGGMMPINVAVSVDGVPFRQCVCSVRVHVYEALAIAVHNLVPEQLLTEADLRMEEREIAAVQAKYFTKTADVVGHVPNQLIREGTLLTQNMLRNPVIFDNGAQVAIVAKMNGIFAKMDGIALQHGRVGAVIRVRNVKSGKILQARVVDAATVEVLQSDAG